MKEHRLPRALGELVVIVLGVLVALGVDSWFEGFSETRVAESYLARLVSDLEADSFTYAFVLEVLEEKDRALLRVARVAAGLEAPDSAFFELLPLTQSMGFNTPGTRRVTYDDLVATGNLRLISDPDLRGSVVWYYTQTAGYQRRIEQRRTEFPQASYRLNPEGWRADGIEGAYSEMAAQALDSIATLRFRNLLNAERTLADFQRDRMHDALGWVGELLGEVRRARDAA